MEWENSSIKKAEKILVVCGQKNFVSDKLKKEIKQFFEKYNSVIAVEYMSNMDFEKGINTNACIDSNFAAAYFVHVIMGNDETIYNDILCGLLYNI